MDNQFDYVIFHKPCSDGVTGAFCAWLSYKDSTFVGLEPRNPFPNELIEKLAGKSVILIDIAFSREIILNIYNVASKLVVLDHHETNRDNLANLDFAHFDMNKSGCMLAWEYFFPNEQMPDFIRYIGLRDIWKHKNVENALYFTCGMEYTESFDELYKYYTTPSLVSKTIKKGSIQYKYMQQVAQDIASKAVDIIWLGYPTKVVNCGWPFTSDVGDLLSQKNPDNVILLWSKQYGKPYSYSLRSNKELGPNVAEIAKLYGGGGHKAASGFSSDLDPDSLIKKSSV